MKKNPTVYVPRKFMMKLECIILLHLIKYSNKKTVDEALKWIPQKIMDMTKFIAVSEHRGVKGFDIKLTKNDFPKSLKRLVESNTVSVVFGVPSKRGKLSGAAAFVQKGHGYIRLVLPVAPYLSKVHKINNFSLFYQTFSAYRNLINHEKVHILQAITNDKLGRTKSGVGIKDHFLLSPMEQKAYLETILSSIKNMIHNEEYISKEEILKEVHLMLDELTNGVDDKKAVKHFREKMIKDIYKYLNKLEYL